MADIFYVCELHPSRQTLCTYGRGGAVNARRVSTPKLVLICTVVGLLHARAHGGLS